MIYNMKTIMRTAVFFTMPLLYLVLFADTLSAQTPYSGGMYIDVRWDRTEGPTPSARPRCVWST